MKTKIINDLTQYAIPDGEGFNALPIVFIYVIARSGATKQSPTLRLHSSQNTRRSAQREENS
jgi:hypothetical protein